MNDEIMVQALLDSFDIIKDSWDTKSDAIVNAIAAMTNFHRKEAYDMWLYEMDSIKNELNYDNTQKLVTGIYKQIGLRDGYYTHNWDSDFSRFTKMLWCLYNLFDDIRLYELFYQYSYNYAIDYPDGSWTMFNMRGNPLGWIFAYIISTGDTNKIKKITNSILRNKNYKEVPPSRFLRDSIKIFNENFVDYDDSHFNISDEARLTMLEVVECSDDEIARSEMVIAILSIR